MFYSLCFALLLTKSCTYVYTWTSLVAQMVKNLPVMWETWVQSLGLEDSPEEGMATHSSIVAWRIPMDRGVWQAIQPMGSQRVRHDWATNTQASWHWGRLKKKTIESKETEHFRQTETTEAGQLVWTGEVSGPGKSRFSNESHLTLERSGKDSSSL